MKVIDYPHPEVEELSDYDLRLQVAEHVVGLHVERVKPDWYEREVFCFYDPAFPQLVAYSWDANACNAMMFCNGKDASAGYAPPLPSYESEDSGGAEYEVINAMIGRGYHFRLCGFDVTHRGEDAKREYEAEFLPRGSNHEQRFISTADVPQLAIARAAVKASLAAAPPVTEE